jgi:hypothetical protein
MKYAYAYAFDEKYKELLLIRFDYKPGYTLVQSTRNKKLMSNNEFSEFKKSLINAS